MITLKKIYRRLFPIRDNDHFGRVGKGCVINPNSNFKKENIFVDDYVMLQNGINFISRKGRLFVGKYSVISSGCVLIPSKHHLKEGVPFFINARYNLGDTEHDIVVKEDCWLGASCIILPDITIGRGAIVGAGSVVTKDVLPYTVVAGNPARVIGLRLDRDGIIAHEKQLYTSSERMSIEAINSLCDKFNGYKIHSDKEISVSDKEKLFSYLQIMTSI